MSLLGQVGKIPSEQKATVQKGELLNVAPQDAVRQEEEWTSDEQARDLRRGQVGELEDGVRYASIQGGGGMKLVVVAILIFVGIAALVWAGMPL